MNSSHNNELNLLSINNRNFSYISRYNKRKHFPLVDDKIICKSILGNKGIPCPETLQIISSFVEIRPGIKRLENFPDFVIKPSRGRAGGGILLLKPEKDNFITPGGRTVTQDSLVKHLGDILFGVYSFGKMGDRVLVEKKIKQHSLLNSFYSRGIADIRIIMFRKKAAMAMLRIPTDRSDGKANLHQGAIGLSVDLVSGITGTGIYKNRRISMHPDSGNNMTGEEIPFWKDILKYCHEASEEFPLEYLGVDIVIDENSGPMILELNARPGLQIQVVNETGLYSVLKKIENDDEQKF